MTHTENEFEITNYKKQPYNANYLNNLLLETIHTLNSMRDVISNFEKPHNIPPPVKTHFKENINSEKKTVIINL